MPQYTKTLAESLEVQAGILERLPELMKNSSGFGGNATFAKPPTPETLAAYEMVQALIWAIASGQRFLFKGDSGIGKTKVIKWFCQLLGIEVVLLPLATMSIENIMVPTPTEDEHGNRSIEHMFYEQLMTPNLKMIFIDEIGRPSDRSILNTVLELLQEGTIANIAIPGLVGVVAADNPGTGMYGKIQSMDLAQASRFVTIEVDTTSTPWQHALAAQFAEVDLSKLYLGYAKLDREQRIGMSPAILESVGTMVLNGHPGIYGIPKVGGARQKVVNAAGRDTTDEVLEMIAASLGMPLRQPDESTPLKALEFALREGFRLSATTGGFTTFYGEGPPGVGKTALVKQLLADIAADAGSGSTVYMTAREVSKAEQDRIADQLAVYMSAPAMQPEDLVIPFATKSGKLEVLLMKYLSNDTPKVIVIDEVFRSSRRTANSLMELTGEGSVGGRKIPGLVCIIGLNNPREVAGYKLDVGKSDPAQARRFKISVDLSAEAMPAINWLRSTYGDEYAGPFLDWWQEDLGALERLLVPPRVLEMMIRNYAAGLDIKTALPVVGDERVPVSLADLHTRLDKRPQARLRAIAANVEKFEADMVAEETSAEAQATVFIAFSKAELSLLKEHRDAVIRLLAVLERQNRILLLQSPGQSVSCGKCASCKEGRETTCTKKESRQTFWAEALKDMAARSKQS
jgi:MoxR-like ATPase